MIMVLPVISAVVDWALNIKNLSTVIMSMQLLTTIVSYTVSTYSTGSKFVRNKTQFFHSIFSTPLRPWKFDHGPRNWDRYKKEKQLKVYTPPIHTWTNEQSVRSSTLWKPSWFWFTALPCEFQTGVIKYHPKETLMKVIPLKCNCAISLALKTNLLP